MADKIFTGRVKLKKDTKTNFETQNPVLLNGEIGIATTNNGYQVKCGNGSSTWNALISLVSVDFPSGEQTDSLLQSYSEGTSKIYANTIAGYSGWAVVRTYWENPTGTRILQIVEFATGVRVTRMCTDGTWGEWQDLVGDINSVLEGVL